MAIATCRQSRNKLRFRPMVLHMPAMVRNGQPGEKHKRIFYGLHLIAFVLLARLTVPHHRWHVKHHRSKA
jgi:hypothetical protein